MAKTMEFLKDAKVRGILLIVTVILGLFGIAYYLIQGTQQKEVPSETTLTAPPSIKTLPGIQEGSREYTKLQQQENILRAQEAARTGGTNLPTITRTGIAGPDSFIVPGDEPIVVADCTEEELVRARKLGAQAKDLRERGCDTESLRAAGYTATEMLAAGFPVVDLLAAGYSVADLKKAGVTAKNFRAAGINAKTLKAAGFTIDELMAAGFDATDLLLADFTENQLRQAGFAEPSIDAAKRTAARLAEGGGQDVDLADLIKARREGKSIKDLQAQGFSLADLKAKPLLGAGYTVDDLKKAGYTAKDLRDAGVSAGDLLAAGFTIDDLRDAGYSAAQLTKAGVTPEELRKAGYTANQLAKAGLDAGQLLAAGYTPEDLREAGFSVKDLLAAGVTPKDLRKAGYTAQQLMAAGATSAQLAAAGFSAEELRSVGLSLADLVNAGVPVKDLLAAGYSQQDLISQGISLQDIERASAELAYEGEGPQNGIFPTQTRLASLSPEQAANLYLERIRQRQAASLSAQERQELIDNLIQNMDSQVSVLVTEWAPPPTQQIVYAEEEKETEEQKAAAQAEKQTKEAGPIIKAGTVYFGVLDVGINSDEESPIMATIVSGPLKGAKLMGAFTRLQKRVLIKFENLNIPQVPSSIKINAVAIDANTARTAIADRVDNHYWLRYGSLFAASFLSGLGQAVSDSGAEIADLGIIGFRVSKQNYSAAEKLAIALGEVGTQFGANVKQNFNRPPTVYVDPGAGIGVLFMADLEIPVSKWSPLAQKIERGGNNQGFEY